MFSDEQKAALAAPLKAEHVQVRSQSGRSLSYIESWRAIAEANRIFGFDGWNRETVWVECKAEQERTIGRDKRPGWGVTYTAKVRVTVGGIVREGVGAGHGIDADLGQAHESAIKEAESDSAKRALMTFGNPFGLALYDKAQENVERSNGATRPKPNGDDIETRLIRTINDRSTLVALNKFTSQESFSEAFGELDAAARTRVEKAVEEKRGMLG